MLANRSGEETMKHNAPRGRKLSELPIASPEAKYAALRANTADTCDDRVSENILDVDDERAGVEKHHSQNDSRHELRTAFCVCRSAVISSATRGGTKIEGN